MDIKQILFILVIFLTNIIQAITGFAGSILAMPASIYLVGYATAKPIVNLVGIIASIGVVILNYKSINFKEFFKIIVVMVIGIITGSIITKYISLDSKIIYYILGIIVIVSTFLNIFKVKLPDSKNNKWFIIFDILVILASGLVQGIFVCGGPILAVYVTSKLKDKNEFRSTLSLIWIITNSIIFVNDISSGYYTMPTINLAVVASIVLIAAIIIGNLIAKKLNKDLFLKITYALLIISGISLFFK